jgi:hypothetical protein
MSSKFGRNPIAVVGAMRDAVQRMMRGMPAWRRARLRLVCRNWRNWIEQDAVGLTAEAKACLLRLPTHVGLRQIVYSSIKFSLRDLFDQKERHWLVKRFLHVAALSFFVECADEVRAATEESQWQLDGGGSADAEMLDIVMDRSRRGSGDDEEEELVEEDDAARVAVEEKPSALTLRTAFYIPLIEDADGSHGAADLVLWSLETHSHAGVRGIVDCCAVVSAHCLLEWKERVFPSRFLANLWTLIFGGVVRTTTNSREGWQAPVSGLPAANLLREDFLFAGERVWARGPRSNKQWYHGKALLVMRWLTKYYERVDAPKQRLLAYPEDMHGRQGPLALAVRALARWTFWCGGGGGAQRRRRGIDEEELTLAHPVQDMSTYVPQAVVPVARAMRLPRQVLAADVDWQ